MDGMWLYRWAHAAKWHHVPWVPGLLRRGNQVLFGCWIPPEAELGEGTQLGYGGLGIVLHRGVRVGRSCLLSQQVTLGGRSGLEGVPVLGDHVRVGAGAKILGPVRVGDWAVIGANAVVLEDVPAGGVVAGVPARLLRIEPDPPSAWRREMGGEP